MTESEKIKKILSPILRVLLFLFAALFVAVRILTIITIFIGILIIWKDSKQYGRILGWFLAFGGLAATIIYYLAYSIEGGVFY